MLNSSSLCQSSFLPHTELATLYIKPLFFVINSSLSLNNSTPDISPFVIIYEKKLFFCRLPPEILFKLSYINIKEKYKRFSKGVDTVKAKNLMKKTTSLIVGLLLTFSVGIAKANDITLKDQAGITPDSILYPVDKAIDELSIALSFSDETKAEKIADVANERLGESEVMVEKGKQDLAEKTLKDYNQKMNEATQIAEKIIESAGDNADKEKIEKIKELQQKLEQKQQKSIEVLQKLQEKVNDNAKETITKIIELQIAQKEAVAILVQKRHELNEIKQQYEAAKEELQKALESGDQEAIAKAQQAVAEYEAKLNAAKEEFKNVLEQKNEIIKEKATLKRQLKGEMKKADEENNVEEIDSDNNNGDNDNENKNHKEIKKQDENNDFEGIDENDNNDNNNETDKHSKTQKKLENKEKENKKELKSQDNQQNDDENKDDNDNGDYDNNNYDNNDIDDENE